MIAALPWTVAIVGRIICCRGEASRRFSEVVSNGPTAIPLKEDVNAAMSSAFATDGLRFGQSSPQSGLQVRLVLVGGGGGVMLLMVVVVVVVVVLLLLSLLVLLLLLLLLLLFLLWLLSLMLVVVVGLVWPAILVLEPSISM